jgi:hypothetical protein
VRVRGLGAKDVVGLKGLTMVYGDGGGKGLAMMKGVVVLKEWWEPLDSMKGARKKAG